MTQGYGGDLAVYGEDHFSLGESLAARSLYLRGADALAFAEQFAAQAARPVAVRLEGDDVSFRQAVCFPVRGMEQTDLLLPVPGVAPCLVIELPAGHLIGLRLTDVSAGRFSLSALLQSIERYLDRLPQGVAAWPGIQKTIEMATCRQLHLINFVLEADAATFWKKDFPKGQDSLAELIFRGIPPTSGLGRKQAIVALRDIQSAHYRSAVEQFIEHLDVEIVRAMRACCLAPTLSQYNTYLRGETKAARNRIQAAQAVPLLGYLLGEDSHRAARLRRLVDDGQPLWPALADTVGVPEEVVRWLRGKTADDISDVWLHRVPELLVSLAQLYPEKRPKIRDEWTAYTDFALVLNKPRQNQQHARWLQDISRIGWLAAREKFAAMQAAPSDLHDIDDLLNEIIGAIGGQLLPHVARRWGSERSDDPEWRAMREAVETLFFDLSVLKQIRTSLRWHQLQLLPHEEEALEETEDQLPQQRLGSWPAPLEAPMKLGGLYAHFLTTPAQLHHEGQRMEHCVGSYAQQCLFSGSNIVSLRRSDGRSLSTAELRLVKKGKQFSFDVIQHRAKRNGAPTSEAHDALARLLSHLSAEAMQPRLQQMRKGLEKRQMLDVSRERWLAETPLAPHRLRALKTALKLHAGYARFQEAAQNAIGV
jgi:hypothetical protein